MEKRMLTAEDIIDHLGDILDGTTNPYGGWVLCLNLAIGLAEQEPDKHREIMDLVWQVVWFEAMPLLFEDRLDLQSVIGILNIVSRHQTDIPARFTKIVKHLLPKLLGDLLDQEPFPFRDESKRETVVFSPQDLWTELDRSAQELENGDDLYLGEQGGWLCYLQAQREDFKNVTRAFKLKIIAPQNRWAILLWTQGNERPVLIADEKKLAKQIDINSLVFSCANQFANGK